MNRIELRKKIENLKLWSNGRYISHTRIADSTTRELIEDLVAVVIALSEEKI
jgi:hypothetical protein